MKKKFYFIAALTLFISCSQIIPAQIYAADTSVIMIGNGAEIDFKKFPSEEDVYEKMGYYVKFIKTLPGKYVFKEGQITSIGEFKDKKYTETKKGISFKYVKKGAKENQCISFHAEQSDTNDTREDIVFEYNKKYNSVSWKEEGILYQIIPAGIKISKTELTKIAKEISN